MNKTILIIEDDPAIAEIERDFLEIDGFCTEIVADGVLGLEKALGGGYDLILLDLMLPGMDGFAICRKIRGAIDVPLLMVTARMEDIDKIRGLGLGADDYITKPFSPAELVARVKANLAFYERLKGTGVTNVGEISLGPVRINSQGHQVFVRGQEVEFTNKEYDLLFFLLTQPNVVFSKEILYERIWGADSYGDLKTVAVHINRLREKVEQNPANPVHIQTVWGVGYRYCA